LKKVVIDRPGGYRQLKIRACSLPVPKRNEVLVAVSAAGVNFADVIIRVGLYRSAKTYVGWPITPGFEFSGRVAQRGAEVSDLVIGASVFGVTRFGGYASHVCVPREQVFAIPQNAVFTLEDWAAFPTAFLTAYHGLFQNIVLRPRMKILIHSAAGGVGSALLQLGKIAECEMTGVVGSSHKVETARSFGADHVIDKSKENLWQQAAKLCPAGFDAIFDANGPSTLKASYRNLAPMGKLVIYGFHGMFSKKLGVPNYVKLARDYLRIPRWNPLAMTQENRSVIAFNLSYLFDHIELLHHAMWDLLRWVSEGKIKAPILRRFPLEKVADAHRALQSGQTVGRLVLQVLP
jgi:NADPH:quinone reductase-like Zn-dependent oxidoreductase